MGNENCVFSMVLHLYDQNFILFIKFFSDFLGAKGNLLLNSVTFDKLSSSSCSPILYYHTRSESNITVFRCYFDYINPAFNSSILKFNMNKRSSLNISDNVFD
jgi:hypothetical protein